jgi:hypothetical protein
VRIKKYIGKLEKSFERLKKWLIEISKTVGWTLSANGGRGRLFAEAFERFFKCASPFL